MSAPISVVICAYTERRWDDLVAAVASVQRQTLPPEEIVVVVDHNPDLLERALWQIPGITLTHNHERRGLSGARNSGVAVTSGSVIAFLDDDALAEPRWLEQLSAGYERPEVLGVGGAIEPLWASARPAFFPEEFDWVVGCTYRGMPRSAGPVRNLIGANMSFRREVFDAVGGFHHAIGRVGKRPSGCEETELCIRALRHWPQGCFLYQPLARVRHRVPSDRASWGYFRSRCYAEGLSKALVARLAGSSAALTSERAYVLSTLPRGIARGVTQALARRDPAGLVRSAAITAGLAVTTAGYVVGTARSLRAGRAENGTARPLGAGRAGVDNRNPSNPQESNVTELGQLTVARADAETDGWLEFNLHDCATMRVRSDAPTAPILADMFAPFRTRGLAHHDLTVTSQMAAMPDPSHAEHDYRYAPTALHLLRTGVQILVEEDGLRLNGTRELLTSALPLLDSIAVGRGAAMIHAATFDYRGIGVALPAWGGVGKTSTIAKLMRLEGAAFMGDDWAFMSGNGRLLGYAKPMFIKPHHRPIYPHLFASKRKPLVPTALSRPVAELTTLVHPLVTQCPRLAAFARRWSPEYLMVRPEEAFPNTRIATSAPLATAIFVERFDGSRAELAEQDTGWMVSRLIGNFNAELAHHSRDVLTALAATGLLPIERFFADKATVLANALADKPVYLLRVPASLPPDTASDVIVHRLFHILERQGIA